MAFYAHSTESGDKAEWQTLSGHLTAVGSMAAEFASAFGGSSLAQAAGLLHDLGKYTREFQQRLEGGPKVDHATWGARIAKELYPQVAPLLAYAIAGHHAGLSNGKNPEKRTSLADRLGKDLPELLDAWRDELVLPDASIMGLPDGFRPLQVRGMFQVSFLARMIFSCLVDADFIDTDEFYRNIECKRSRHKVAKPSLAELRGRLDSKLSKFKVDTDVNRLRSDILSHVRNQASLLPGLFSMTVPTGGGKTLASLAFALDHAIQHGLKRIIYVIPFTSIVEQNAQVFRDAFGDLGEDAVLEHHSAFIEDSKTEWDSKDKRRLAMENWDAPIVVTTSVQFFESLFADRPSRCRKLHHIANSVVILDEAQAMPLKLLRPCVAAIDELAFNYRASVVLCTATQPALRTDHGFAEGLENVRELAPNPPVIYEKLRRVNVRHIGTLDDEELACRIRQREQVLCIVNNRRHARALYNSIADEPGAYHLTTLMYASHRRDVLDEVRQKLKAGQPCRLIATSLIEAGVDVDFPAVFRAEAGLDSIAQAAGRCNREGKWPFKESKTFVFATENPDWCPPLELKQFAETFRSVFRHYKEDLLSLDAVQAYFKELYWRKGRDALDAENLMGMLLRCREDGLPFETLSMKFRMIEETMKPLIIPYHPGTDIPVLEVQEALNGLEYAPGLARRFQSYLVQVPERAHIALEKSGAIQAVAPERYGRQFMKLVNSDLYSRESGLDWNDSVFISAERSVI